MDSLEFERNSIFSKFENKIISNLIKAYRNIKNYMKSIIKTLTNKILCISQRIKYKFYFMD